MYGIYAPGTSAPNSGHAAGWSDAGVIVPWTSWLQSGDTRIIEQNWDAMTKYLATIEQDNPDHLWKNNAGIPFGDWLSRTAQTKRLLIQTAYWAYDVTLMREMAHAAGRTEEEQKYAALFAKIKDAFAKEFVQPDGLIPGADNGPSQFGRIFEPGKSASADTQTGYVLALYMHLVPDAVRAKAAERLVEKIKANNWRLGTGFLGTPYLLAVLAETGHQDVAFRLLLNTAYPSWGYLVGHGATTMWERWNGDQMRGDPSMNSYNHYAYGAVADWIYRYAAGVDARATDAGFHTIYLHPNFDARLGSLSLIYASPYGEIRSAWKMSGREARWKVTVPANARAELPLKGAVKWSLDGQPLAKSNRVHVSDDGERIYELAAGTYSFTAHQGK
jgi:alpha-L-rhamnosidase